LAASSRKTEVTPEAARAAFDRWIETAGPGSERPVAAVAANDLIGELVAGRTTSTAALIAAANAPDAPDELGETPDSPLAQSASRLVTALDRIDARRAWLRVRREPDARADSSDQGSEMASSYRPIDDTGVRVSGLRRLAMRAGAEIRSIANDTDYEPAPWMRRERSDASSGSITLLPEADDDTLARRIADILTREARRHGVETGGIEP
jgi:hypothetical protein